jgi:hypothetical protein
MQEAFVAALLAIARREQPGDDGEDGDEEGEEGEDDETMVQTVDLAEDDWVQVLGNNKPLEDDDDDDDDDDPELDELPLWVEIKKQVAILREGMEDKTA